jgi:hypothetical protein
VKRSAYLCEKCWWVLWNDYALEWDVFFAVQDWACIHKVLNWLLVNHMADAKTTF